MLPVKTMYEFNGRLKAHFPSQIIVDVTEVCNLECIHCPHPDFKKSSHYTKSFLDADLHKKMIDEVSKFGKGSTQYIRYTSNGEPLIHPQIYDMLDYAVRNSGVFITLTTNGTTMNERRIEKLLKSGLNMIDISIDAFTSETYARIRRGGDLSITCNNVLKLIDIKRRTNSATKIVVSFVEQEINSNEILAFESYWKERGVDFVVLRRIHSAAGYVKNLSIMLKTQGLQRKPCLYPWERITLNPRGELAFCPQDWVHGSVLSHYSKTTIREIWQGSQYIELRKAHLGNSFEQHRFCGDCPDWSQTRWPWEGESYANLIETLSNQK